MSINFNFENIKNPDIYNESIGLSPGLCDHPISLETNKLSINVRTSLQTYIQVIIIHKYEKFSKYEIQNSLIAKNYYQQKNSTRSDQYLFF